MARPPLYKIHPAIGIARVGDADSFFIGPETPGLRPTGEKPGTAVPPYKDGGKIKPQAARFRIYEYVDKGDGNYTNNGEISMADPKVVIQWKVHVANRKASFREFDGLAGSGSRPPADKRNKTFASRKKLDIDPKERQIMGRKKGPIEIARKKPNETWPADIGASGITSLGRLMTDGDGRLLVIGSRGDTAHLAGNSLTDTFNNDGWFDDVFDGPVSASLVIDGEPKTVVSAWVMCGPPDFAPQLQNIVTLYDAIYDVAARGVPIPAREAAYLKGGPLERLARISEEFKKAGKFELSKYEPDYATEILPLLSRIELYRYVMVIPAGVHTGAKWANLGSKDTKYAAERKAVFDRIRIPELSPGASTTASSRNMPQLKGDIEDDPVDYYAHLTVTPTQYAILRRWADGNFVESKPAPPANKPDLTPHGLDRAALENCVGGAFYPGIEAGWLVREAGVYAEPFRVKLGSSSTYGGKAETVKAGHFSRQMALPWQTDFLECETGSIPGWWPAQRPDFVTEEYHAGTSTLTRQVFWHRATKGGAAVKWPSGDDKPTNEEM
ncbi:MAG TPA: LodA/GoxA family CTQ-dependent oxidase, partial [Dongiaceae bacterium]|nr:LodA/GoxA family CTQ-dependent oxidase [Dongiaceae bacterium]